jgi:hypothetical protein
MWTGRAGSSSFTASGIRTNFGKAMSVGKKREKKRIGLVSIELHALMRHESRPFLVSSSVVAAVGRVR